MRVRLQRPHHSAPQCTAPPPGGGGDGARRSSGETSVGELPPLEALEQHSALRPTRLVPALVVALAVGVLVGVVRRRVS